MTKRKVLLLALAVVLLLTSVVAGVIAWMVDSTESVVNTFTPANIKINLDEADTDDSTAGKDRDMANTYEMVPGFDLDKDPTVTVLADSVDCWLFVKIDAENNAEDFLTYAIADGWTQGKGTDVPTNVYYRKVTKSDADQPFAILKDNKVTVKTTVTAEDLAALTAATYPTLSFTAYAVQLQNGNDSEFTVNAAWTEALALANG